jgi:Tol biopolymer transport system component
MLVEGKGGNCFAPQILPDGENVLFTQGPAIPGKIVVQSLKTGERKELIAGDSAQYLPTGHLVYGLTGCNDLFAVPFDLDTLKVTGDPVPIVKGILRVGGAPQYAVSDTGTLVYMPGTSVREALPKCTFVWVNRDGQEESLKIPPQTYRSPRISPDGTKIVFSIMAGGNLDIWVWDLIRKSYIRITMDEAEDYNPIWTPDGRGIVFTSDRGGNYGIYLKAADGRGDVERFSSVQNPFVSPWFWLDDGKTLSVMGLTSLDPLNFDIGSISKRGDEAIKPLLEENHIEAQPRISPDGQWMAYTSNQSGRNEVYVCPFPEVNKERHLIISTSGGDSPLWSPDGRTLFYRSDDDVMEVTVETEPTFKPGIPERLFRGNYVSARVNIIATELNPWDIGLDGKQFLMMKPSDTTAVAFAARGQHKINIVLNWFEELKERVPTD